uniref:Major facilitator superfamily (MFS) profile domain-containing protein n=1 Tax=Picochlorum oklahomense TaxID=249345 RepID=A0A7S1CV42_9CHLO|mmetsp:Transcript_274/g.632  ORF Transcript_274/g.632 Transcript_274/m.632 type:complete len:521 (+) Transcript_274:108-1670(+)
MSLFEGHLMSMKPDTKGFRGFAPARFFRSVPSWKAQQQGRPLNIERSLKVGVQTPGIVQEGMTEGELCEEPSPGSLGLVQKEDAVGSDRVLRVFLVACSASIMAAVSRTSFSVLAIPIQERFALSMADMGLIQSSLLFGYIVGQIPAGVLADNMGGISALVLGMAAWSLFGVFMLGIPMAGNPIAVLFLLRCGLGFSQSVLMPGISATSAQSFSPMERGDKTSGIYACYSIGTVASLIITPVMADSVGTFGTFTAFGVVGIICSIFGLLLLSEKPFHRLFGMNDILSGARQRVQRAPSKMQRKSQLARFRRHSGDLMLLCWTHAVIGFGFFVLQSWIPTFLHSLGVNNLYTLGVLSAMPWLLTAAVAAVSGRLSRYLEIKKKWNSLKVRRLFQIISSLGGAQCLLLLVFQSQNISPLIATASISIAVAFQGLCYPGFHSYVQDIASNDAGVILALTNSCSIAAGILGNVVTGHLAASTFGFRAVFALTAGLYLLSSITWFIGATGRPIRLTHLRNRLLRV